MLKGFPTAFVPKHPLRSLRRLYDTTLPETKAHRHSDAQRFWSDSATNPATQDLSHWAGKGRWSDEKKWKRIGETHLDMFRTLSQFAPSGQIPTSMVEWGPGGGANLVSFAPQMNTLYGVDISEANLTECLRHLTVLGFTEFRPILIEAGNPEHVLQAGPHDIDFFLSTAVYQHFPSKDYGVRVTRIAFELLRPGGLGLIQIRYDDDTPRFRGKVRNYQRNAVTFTSYRIPEFWRVLLEVGFSPIAMTLQPNVNYAYFFCKKRGTDG